MIFIVLPESLICEEPSVLENINSGLFVKKNPIGGYNIQGLLAYDVSFETMDTSKYCKV